MGKKFSKVWKNGLFAVLVLAAAVSARGADFHLVMTTNVEAHLRDALRCMRMTEVDLGFEKDYGKPQIVLQRARKLLSEPLGLPAMADEILATGSPNCPPAVWLETAHWLEVKISDPAISNPADAKSLTNNITVFAAEAQRAEQLLARAFGALTDDEKRYAAAAFFAGTFNAEDKPDVRADLVSVGVSPEEIQQAIMESLNIDPEPSSTNFLAVLGKVDIEAVLEAGRIFQQAVYELRDAAKGMEWPAVQTRFGEVVIGTTGADVYTNGELLILDPGGDDTYSGDAGSANGLQGRPLAVIVDLGGDDRYLGDRVLGPGAAVFGVSVLLDGAGHDLYRAKYVGQASAFFGVGWLEDREGDDVYRARAHSQAAGYVGLGYLRDDVATIFTMWALPDRRTPGSWALDCWWTRRGMIAISQAALNTITSGTMIDTFPSRRDSRSACGRTRAVESPRWSISRATTRTRPTCSGRARATGIPSACCWTRRATTPTRCTSTGRAPASISAWACWPTAVGRTCTPAIF